MMQHLVKTVEHESAEEYAKMLTSEMNRMERGGYTWSLQTLTLSEATGAGKFRAVLTGTRVKPPVTPRASKGGDAGEVTTEVV